MGFEPVTSTIRVQCSTNWPMKPHIGSEVNLLSSYLPVRNEMMWCVYEIIHIWTAVIDESEEWSSQYILQFKQLERRSLKKIRAYMQKIYCDDHSSLSSTTAVHIWIILYTHHIISFLTGRYELNKLTSLPMCGFIAQLVEHRTGIAEVTGSNPVEALIFFRLLLSNCLNWKIYCNDHSSLSSTTAVHIWIISYTHHKGRKKKNL